MRKLLIHEHVMLSKTEVKNVEGRIVHKVCYHLCKLRKTHIFLYN